MVFVTAVMWGQTYSTCTIGSSSSSIKGANLDAGKESRMYDGDWGSYWRSYSWEDVYINDSMKLNIKSPQLVDYVVVKRAHQADRTGTERYPGLQFWYIETGGTAQVAIPGGTFANGEQATKSFNIGKNIQNIGFKVVSGNYSASAVNYNHMSMHEIELRRYHRLALTLTQDAGLDATHNGVKNNFTILSTQAKVHYDTKITGLNRKLEGWYWNGTLVNQGFTFDYTHTVNIINDTGTMHVKAVDCIPTFERANVSLSIGLGHYTNPLTTDENNGAPKTFTSSNEAVATVDNTGKLTLRTVGTTTITMTQPSRGVYGPMLASYTLTVDNIGVLVTGGMHAGYYGLDNLPASIQGATKIETLGENWTDTNITQLKGAMAGSKDTLSEIDMATLTFSESILNGMQSLFSSGYSVLKKVTLPSSVQTVSINLSHAFANCAVLTDIVNLPNLHNVTDLMNTFSGCVTLKNVSFLLSDNATNNNAMEFYSTFANCKALANIDLSSYTNIAASHGVFNQCVALKTVTFSTAANNNSVTMCQAFSGCSALEYIHNFNSFKKVSDLSSTFNNCSSLKEIRLGVEPSTVSTSNLSGTFTSANNTYLKYLGAGTTDIPQQWKDQDYKNFVLPITITIPEQEDVQVGHALDLPTDPVLPTYAARRGGQYQVKKEGESEWVTFNPATLMDITYSDAELRYIAQSYLNTSIVSSNIVIIRLKKPSLFVNGDITVDTEAKYDTVQINANGHLTLTADITTEVLILKCAKIDRYNLNQDAGRIAAKSIELHVATDGATWSWFSVPFDFSMSEVIADNSSTHGAYNTAWQIKEYSEHNRAVQGFYGNNWLVVAAGSGLSALHGYIVSNSEPASAPLDVKFKKSYGDTYTEINLPSTVAVGFTNDDNKSSVGWNMISAPTLEDTQFILSSDETNDIVVNIPINYGANGYNQILSSQYTFKPSESFFVQVASAGELTFNKQSAPSSAPSYMRSNSIEAGNERYELRISDTNGNTDQATLTFRDDAPYDEYLIEHDVEKLTVYKDMPRIYFPDHGLRLAFSTENTYDNTDIPLSIYVPAAGEYILNTPNSSTIEVYDTKYGQVINVDEYVFDAKEAGHVEGRFVVRHTVHFTPTDEIVTEKDKYEISTAQDGDIYVRNVSVGTAIGVYSANGIMVSQDVCESNSYRLTNLPSGVYIVLVGGEANRVMVK